MKITTTTEVVKVTPSMATEWLAERWGEQRNIRIRHVKRLAADMDAGRFKVGPDAILRIKGKLANGQHRLSAVVESGAAQMFLVMESNDEELYKVIDAGMRRVPSDGLIGIKFAHTLPSIAKWVQAYASGTIRQGARSGSEAGAGAGSASSYSPTQCETIDYCLSNQDVLTEAAIFVNPLAIQTRLLPVSIGGAIYVVASQHNKLEKAKSFLQDVYVGGELTAATDLRNRLIANRGSKSKLLNGYLFGISIKAFRSYCSGTRPGTLKWAKDEGFPAL